MKIILIAQKENNMKKILAFIAALFFVSTVHAQTLPSGSIGTVTSNTPNTWQIFNYTFTPSTTGANFLGFAFRQDPAFWTFDNVRLIAAGSTTNLLVNGAFDHGGQFSVTTNNGPSNIQAPTNWGVWYQNGTYPAAAGAWQDSGGTHGGVWYDGAVGSFDGIYQGVVLQAGTTYTISFEVSGNHAANTSSIQLGVYGGACATVTIAPDQCTIPSSVGFTTLATPSQGAAAGGPPPVTLVSTANGPSTSTASTAYGTSIILNNVATNGNNNGRWIAVTRVTTPVTTRPYTITTVTTPHTIQTYSDGSTVTTNGNPVTTTQNAATVTVGQPASQTASVSSIALKDALAVNRFNPFLVDVLSTKDGAWATPSMGYAKAGGSFRTSSLGFGAQKTVDENTFGIAGTFGKSNSHGYLNSTTETDSYGASAYVLSKQSGIWVKGAVGFGVSEYNTATSLPIFALSNSNKVKTKNYYADLTFYSSIEYLGLRPLVGVTVVNSTISSKSETGSVLLSTLPQDDRVIEARPYAGIRYDFNDFIGLETRVTRSRDFNTVGQVRLSAKHEVFKDVFFDITAGFDKSSNYTAAVGMVGLKVNF
jgi:hypothetical protein